MRRMKVFVGNLDGQRRGLVAATSQAAAAKVAGCSMSDLRDYWSEWGNPEWTPKPLTLYTKPFDSDAPWVEGRCEIVRKRATTA